MAVKIEKGGWIFIFLIGAGLVAYSLYRYGVFERFIPAAAVGQSSVPPKADLPAANTSAASSVPAAPLPGNAAGCSNSTEVRFLVWAWNAQMGAMFANGGPQATRGSFACNNQVNLMLKRQDDTGKMQEELIAFANELHGGKAQPTKGSHFVAIMGDGSATFLKAVNDNLGKLGPEYKAKVIGSGGYSRGEDKF